MAKNSVDLFLSVTQDEFVASEHENTLFSGGLGSGKTFAGAVWSAINPLKYPGVPGVITANSYSQLRKATLQCYFEVLDKLGIPFKYKQNDSTIIVNNTPIYAMSMEKYDLLRGIEVGWAWSDECAFYKREAFDVLKGRIRKKAGSCQWKGTTTPNGFNWLYDAFVEKPLNDSLLIKSKTKDNIENLSESYYNTLRQQYDSRLARQELDGEFVNLNSGKVYYSFDRFEHCKDIGDTGNIIFVGLDFNVHPLCGVFAYEKNGIIFVFDELYLEDSNTFEASEEIARKYGHRKPKVISDDSGAKRKTSAKQTDHKILKSYGLDVLKFRNPGIKDRQNNVNRLFYHNKLIVSRSCVKLIADLEKLVHDNKDDMLSHMSDALGYLCWHLQPMQKPKRPSKVFHY